MRIAKGSIFLLILFTIVAPLWADQPLSNKDIVRMVQAGLGSEIIVSKIQHIGSVDFDLSTDGLIALKQAKVPDAVISEMMKRADQSTNVVPATSASAATASQGNAVKPAPAPATASTATPAPKTAATSTHGPAPASASATAPAPASAAAAPAPAPEPAPKPAPPPAPAPVQAAPATFQGKPIILIASFTTASGTSWPYDMKELQKLTANQLGEKAGAMYSIVTEIPENGTGHVYKLDAEVTSWRPGNAAKRWLVGMGSGREAADIHYWLTDETGNKVFDRSDTIRAEFWGNAYAGSVGQLAYPFAEKIAERLKDAKLK